MFKMTKIAKISVPATHGFLREDTRLTLVSQVLSQVLRILQVHVHGVFPPQLILVYPRVEGAKEGC